MKHIFVFFGITCILLISCKKEPIKKVFIPNTGQIQVLNGCGFAGAAESVRNYLSQKGFDIIEFGNSDHWNHKETIVVARTENMLVAQDLAKVLNTKNLIQILDSSRMVEATVYVGKDYYKRIKE